MSTLDEGPARRRGIGGVRLCAADHYKRPDLVTSAEAAP